MKRKKLLLLLVGMMWFLPRITLAEEKISLINTIENISNPTSATITYQLTPNAENESGASNEPTKVEVSFTGQEVIENTITKEVEIDFSEAYYPKAGTYKYGLSQKQVDDTNIVLSSKMYEIYVQVTLKEDGTLEKEVVPLAVDLDDIEKETLEYRNTTRYTSITIETKVDGNLKEYDKETYFKYQVSIYGPVGSKYTITGQDEIVTYKGEKIETVSEYIVQEGKESNFVYIYLKDGQSVTIGLNEENFKEIPIGTEYSIKKIDGEKWETTIDSVEQDSKTSITGEEENYSLIVNARDYDSAITGLFYNYMPYVILMGFLVASLILIKISKKKSKEE